MKVLAVRSPRQNRESPESSESAGINGEVWDMPPVAFVDLPTALAQEAEHLIQCGEGEEAREAIQAFIEKRKPQFH